MSMPNETSSAKLDTPISQSPPSNGVAADDTETQAVPQVKANAVGDGEPSSESELITNAVKKIATELAEENEHLIKRIVEEIGVKRSLNVLKRTLVIEAGDGIMTHDGSRRRTPGGAFFFLVRGRISLDQYYRVWEKDRPDNLPVKPKAKKSPKKRKDLPWQSRIALFKEIAGKHGQASQTEVKLVGRPIKVLPRGKVVILTLRNRDQPGLPKGLPKVPDDATVFLVFLTLKQWKKIANSMRDKSDKMIITGFPVFSNKLNAIAVWAQRAISVNMDKARREKNK